jgi:hypothetical protein
MTEMEMQQLILEQKESECVHTDGSTVWIYRRADKTKDGAKVCSSALA